MVVDLINTLSILIHVYIYVYLVTCGASNCNGHGTCETIDNLYLEYISTSSSDIYSLWDSGHTTTCICDIGYTGTSCNMRK